MLNTKLILVDGITGSGKSTTAHYIARQLEKNGIKAKWFYEEEEGNPFSYVPDYDNETMEEFTKKFLTKFTELISEFIDNVKNDDYIYISEAHLFQNNLDEFLSLKYSKTQIKIFYDRYQDLLQPLKPVIIRLYQNNVTPNLKDNLLRRGGTWSYEAVNRRKDYSPDSNLSNEEKYIIFWQDISDYSYELINYINFPKLQIENSEKDWDRYRKQILDFLELKKFDEVLFEPSFEDFCGFYSGFTIHVKDTRLCIDAFWPNLKLIPVAKDEFALEGFSITIKFFRDECNNIKSFIFTRALSYYDANYEYKKIPAITLDSKELEFFCGTYFNESNDCIRKITLKDEQLFYEWNLNDLIDTNKLIPISKNQLGLAVEYSAMLDFDLKKDIKQFTLKVQNQNDQLFVQTSP